MGMLVKYGWLVVFIAAIVSACGGSSSNNGGGATTNTEVGVFIDSPVVNIGYRTATQEGVTNANGEYLYLPGEEVTFFIGDLDFPATTAAGVVTPLDLAGTTSLSDNTVVNIIRLLQTLDTDANPENGISLDDAAALAAVQVDFGQSVEGFASSADVLALAMNGGQEIAVTELVSESDARVHFNQQLIGEGLIENSLVGVWHMTGFPSPSVGGSDFTVFLFLADGRYFQADVNEINEGDGMEVGTYTFTGEDITFATTFDTNSEVGVSSRVEPSVLTVALNENSFSFPSDDSREVGDYTFTRFSPFGSPFLGVWSIENTTFAFLDNNQYIGFQINEENGFNGYEFGSYSLDGTDLSITTLDNSDGEALLCNLGSENDCTDKVFGATIIDDQLSLYVPDEDVTVVFSKDVLPVGGFSLDLTTTSASSVMTNSQCPNVTGGFDYVFSSEGMNLTGSDTWQTPDCVLGADESFDISLEELEQGLDIPFNCIDYPICRAGDLNKIVTGTDQDLRSFTSTQFFNQDTNILTYIKEVEGTVFTEVIIVQ